MILTALRNLKREWKGGELRILIIALMVAITSITSVAFFTDRIERVLHHQAGELIAADLLVLSPQAPEAYWRKQAEQQDLQWAETISFPSVVFSGEHSQLASIKAVTNTYPLRGKLKTSRIPYKEGLQTEALPAAGEAWVDSRLFNSLQLKLGDKLGVGERKLKVSRILSYEPDRGGEFFYIAPRVLINMGDLQSTGLVQPASRVKYRFMVSGEDKAIKRMRNWLKKNIRKGDEIQGIRDARPELRVALDRARDFLGLTAMVAVLLAGVAIAISAGRYAHRHFDHCAIMRCLGASQKTIQQLYFYKLLWLGLVTGIAASTLGYLAQMILAEILSGMVNTALPAASLLPMLTGIGTGMLMLLGFALPPLLRLKQTSPLRVLRRDLDPLPVSNWLIYGSAALALAVLVTLQIRDTKLALGFYLGSLVTLVTLALAARALILLLKPIRQRSGITWRFGLANIARRPRSSSTQILGFGIGIMALLLLTMIRNDLLDDWQKTLPKDAPNQFAINIHADQIQDVQKIFQQHQLEAPKLYPMVRGRLTHINGKEVKKEQYTNPRAQRLSTREFNISWYAEPQEQNLVTTGRWWNKNETKNMFSMGEEIAKTLGIKLGDTLTYRIAGRTITAPVTSLRYINWDTFRPNFFLVARPGMLDQYPVQYISSFHLPSQQRDFLTVLVQNFPNITLIDVDAVMRQVRDIMDRVILAIEYVFLFTLAAGIIILFAAIQSTQEERLHEGAILRTLGANRKQILSGIIAEFSVMGLLAGLLAGIGASAIAYFISIQVLNLPFTIYPLWWVSAMLAGTIGIGIAGTLGTLKVTRQTPMETLRG